MIYVHFSIKSVVNWSENSVRFEFFYGNCLLDEPNSVRFYLTVRNMACMYRGHQVSIFSYFSMKTIAMGTH